MIKSVVLILPSIIFKGSRTVFSYTSGQKMALDLYGLDQAGNDAGLPDKELFLKASCLAYVAVHSAYRDHCVLKEHQEDLIKCQSASKNMVRAAISWIHMHHNKWPHLS